jgi:hypothetical protein
MNDDLKYPVCNLCGCPEDDAKPLAPMLKAAFLKEFQPRFEHFCATATIEQIRAFTEILIELTRRQALRQRHNTN